MLQSDVNKIADWLWIELMDVCKKRNTHPGDNNDLFLLVKKLREQEFNPEVPQQSHP